MGLLELGMITLVASVTVEVEARCAAELGERLAVVGNRALDDAVYEALLDGDERDPQVMRQEIESFLHRAGYSLARVQLLAEGPPVCFEVDEGLLEYVVFPTIGAITTLVVAATFELPNDIFNEFRLDQELRKLSERWGYRVATYTLVEVSDIGVGDSWSQLPTVPLSERSSLFRGAARYGLEIILEGAPLPRGLGPFLQFNGVDGFIMGATYRDHSRLLSDELWMVNAALGLRLFKPITDDPQQFISRVLLASRWDSPLFWSVTRFDLGGSGSYLSRARFDLGIARYDMLELYTPVALSLVFSSLTLRASAALRLRQIVRDERASEPVVLTEPIEYPAADPQLVTRLEGEWVIQAERQRNDRSHSLILELEGAFFGGVSPGGAARLFYQKVFRLSYNELWLQSAGSASWGFVPFTSHESVSTVMRGIFDHVFTDLIWGGSIAYRQSLYRGHLHVGPFFNAAVYRHPRELGGSWRGAVGGGMGLHFLVSGAFTVDLYYAVGWSSQGEIDHGPSLSAGHVF